MPEPTAFVVKNGSKTRRCASSGMPGPSSAIRTSTPVSCHGAVVIVIVPVSPSASIALSSRFVQTWLSSDP